LIALPDNPSALNGAANLALDIYDMNHCFPGQVVTAEMWTKKFGKTTRTWERFKAKVLKSPYGDLVHWAAHEPISTVELLRERVRKGTKPRNFTTGLLVTKKALDLANKTLDRIEKRRAVLAHCKQTGRTPLTPDQVREIRRRAAGKRGTAERLEDLAAEFGCTPAHISNIKSGRRRADVV